MSSNIDFFEQPQIPQIATGVSLPNLCVSALVFITGYSKFALLLLYFRWLAGQIVSNSG
jgi:hypothetical protein